MAGKCPPGKGDDGMSDEERRLFESEMRDVRRIDPGPARVTGKEKPPPRPRPAAPDEATSGPALAPLATGATVPVFDPSLPPDARRALRRRQAPPEAELDLHGLRAAEASRRVEAFLHEARTAGRRHVLIVTGRGLRSGEAGP